MATDIDPVAIDVTARECGGATASTGIELIVADGALDDAIAARAPYDLVIANILAGPLVSMAPEIAAIAAPGATIVLAGLLETQARRRWSRPIAGMRLRARARPIVRGDWTILRADGERATRYVADRGRSTRQGRRDGCGSWISLGFRRAHSPACRA